MDPVKKKKLLASLWEAFKSAVPQFLEDVIVKNALKLFFKTAAGSTVQVWLVTFLAKNFAQEVAIPVANAVLVEAKYLIDVRNGKVMIFKLQGAMDAQSYNDAADDIMS